MGTQKAANKAKYIDEEEEECQSLEVIKENVDIEILESDRCNGVVNYHKNRLSEGLIGRTGSGGVPFKVISPNNQL